MKHRKLGILAGLVLLFGVAAAGLHSCTHAPYVLPAAQRTNDPEICFERDILPIFISNCAKGGCHDAESRKSGYQLDNYEHIVSKGIVPGNVAASTIWESVDMHIFGVTHMPEDAPDLTAAQLDLLRRWIATGAVDSGACTSNCDSSNYTFSGAILPLTQKYCVGCHNSASAPGGSLTDYASIREAAVNGRLVGNIEHLPGYNAMPVGLTLSVCQVAQITKWVAAGAPDN